MSHVDGRTLTQHLTVDVDVVVVGSGPAGAAVARVVAASGARVAVVEAGPWLGPEDFALSAFSSMEQSYRGFGAQMAWGTAPTPLVQGKMVGGSSPINGAICWRLPRDVYEGWTQADPGLAEGLPWEDLERWTDALEARLNVAPTAPAVAGRKSALMAAGADALGLAHRPIRRNVSDCEGLGRCMQGCPAGHKNSVDRTLLADAQLAGATVYSSVEVQVVATSRGQATGVQARAVGGGQITFRAGHAVVLAASAIQSPALLLRSGLTQGPVGHGFQGHPGVSMAGRFPDPVRMWEGATQGHEVTGLRREGLKFETLGFDLTVIASRLQGVGGTFAERVHALDHWLDWGAAIRSDAHGRVRVTMGKTWVSWRPSARDVALYRRSLAVMGEMMLAAGASEVSLGVRGFRPSTDRVADLHALETEGPRKAAAYTSVITHMFGGCRIGADPATSVVRPDFRHHHVRGLYVADSSVFPSNTGVNPQISIAALASVCGERVRASSV